MGDTKDGKRDWVQAAPGVGAVLGGSAGLAKNVRELRALHRAGLVDLHRARLLGLPVSARTFGRFLTRGLSRGVLGGAAAGWFAGSMPGVLSDTKQALKKTASFWTGRRARILTKLAAISR